MLHLAPLLVVTNMNRLQVDLLLDLLLVLLQDRLPDLAISKVLYHRQARTLLNKLSQSFLETNRKWHHHASSGVISHSRITNNSSINSPTDSKCKLKHQPHYRLEMTTTNLNSLPPTIIQFISHRTSVSSSSNSRNRHLPSN